MRAAMPTITMTNTKEYSLKTSTRWMKKQNTHTSAGTKPKEEGSPMLPEENRVSDFFQLSNKSDNHKHVKKRVNDIMIITNGKWYLRRPRPADLAVAFASLDIPDSFPCLLLELCVHSADRKRKRP